MKASSSDPDENVKLALRFSQMKWLLDDVLVAVQSKKVSVGTRPFIYIQSDITLPGPQIDPCNRRFAPSCAVILY